MDQLTLHVSSRVFAPKEVITPPVHRSKARILQFCKRNVNIDAARESLGYHRAVKTLPRIVVLMCCLIFAVTAGAQEGETEEPQTYKEQYEKYKKQAKKAIEYPWFVGGAVGFAFGSETSYAEFSPVIGYRISHLFQLGGSLTFRYR